MKSKGPGFFWASYTDLMISLFFIMLVLYVMTFVRLKSQQLATEQQLKKITEIQNAARALPQEYFTYQPEYKRFTLNRQIQFDTGKSVIKDEYKSYLLDVGREIERLIRDLKSRYQNENIKYMVVIEGMASLDKSPEESNYNLSYYRAFALRKLWNDNKIELDSNICELQIAGSGIGGVGRESEEVKNQRFLIQIIPKIGDLADK